MKKIIVSLLMTSTLMLAFAGHAQDIDFSAIMDQNQFGKIEAAMINSVETDIDQLEKVVLSKEANFNTDDLNEGKMMAAMVTMVLSDIAEIRAKISNGVNGDEIDNLDLRVKELKSIVSEF